MKIQNKVDLLIFLMSLEMHLDSLLRQIKSKNNPKTLNSNLTAQIQTNHLKTTFNLILLQAKQWLKAMIKIYKIFLSFDLYMI